MYLGQEAKIPFGAIENGRNSRQLSGIDYIKDIASLLVSSEHFQRVPQEKLNNGSANFIHREFMSGQFTAQ